MTTKEIRKATVGVASPRRAAWLPGARNGDGRHVGWRDRLIPYLFISPAYLLFITFICLPLVSTVVISFLDWPLLGSPHLAGLANYSHLSHDSVLLDALRNTFIFTALTVVIHLVLALALAMAVNATRSRFVRYLTRTAFFAPFLMSSGVVALMWGGLVNHDFGPIAYYLELLGMHPPDFLNSSFWVIPSLVIVDVWQTLGFTFIIFLVGLQSIPLSLYEAARVDGAGRWRRFFRITLPMLSPTTFFAVIISFVGAFQIFTWMDVITNGGPGNASISMVEYVYRAAFQKLNLSYGSTIAVVILVVLLIVTGLQFGLSRWWVHYERM
jgi:ABC-type sugar transport system permease subunit